MPLIIKKCVRCGNWLKHSQRKRNCLCSRCQDKIKRLFQEHIAQHGPICSSEGEPHEAVGS